MSVGEAACLRRHDLSSSSRMERGTSCETDREIPDPENFEVQEAAQRRVDRGELQGNDDDRGDGQASPGWFAARAERSDSVCRAGAERLGNLHEGKGREDHSLPLLPGRPPCMRSRSSETTPISAPIQIVRRPSPPAQRLSAGR